MNNVQRKKADNKRSKWAKVTNIATIVAIATGVALSGQISHEGHSVAWDLPSVIEPWVTVLFIAASAIAGKGKFEVKKIKRILKG